MYTIHNLQKQITKQYNCFVREAMYYFPNNTSLRTAKGIEPDFNGLISIIFRARSLYPGYRQKSIILCESIADFSAVFYMSYLTCDKDNNMSIEDVVSKSVLEHSKFKFSEFSKYESDIDIHGLVLLIMKTNHYINKEETTVRFVHYIVSYLIQSNNKKQIKYYLKRKTEINSSKNFLKEEYVEENNLDIIKEPRLRVSLIYVKPSKQKKSKNKKKTSSEQKLKALLERGECFYITNKKPPIGAEKIIINDSFDSILSFIKKNHSGKFKIFEAQNGTKVLFSNKKIPKY